MLQSVWGLVLVRVEIALVTLAMEVGHVSTYLQCVRDYGNET